MATQALKGKVVVVGGGAKNLGGLISRTFGADGASVVILSFAKTSSHSVDDGRCSRDRPRNV